MAEKRLRAGIDVGGTKIAVGTVLVGGPEDGQVTAFEAFPTPQEPEIVLRRISGTLASLLQRQGKSSADLAAVGLAFPSDLEPETGRVITAPNLPAFVGLVLRDLIARELDHRFSRTIPVAVDNDTCAAVLAEAHYGAGRGFQRLFYLTVSTGVGGARYDGVHPVNLEPGIRTFPDPQRPTECLDDLASGRALAERARLQLQAFLRSGKPLRDVTQVLELEDLAHLRPTEALEHLSARHLAEAAARGDTFCDDLLADSARLTAATLHQLLQQGFGEEKVIVGGSVALKSKGYLDRLRAELVKALTQSGSQVSFVPARDLVAAGLGDERGVIGAALL